MAIKTGTITAKPTLYGPSNAYISGMDKMIAGTGDISATYNSSSSGYGVTYLYGYNFEELREKQNVKITGLKISFTSKEYKTATFDSAQIRCVTNFSATNTYTDLGDGSVYIIEKDGSSSDYVTYSLTETELPNTLEWINNNLEAFLNGYTSNTFGLRLYLKRVYVSAVDITITYEYEETAYFVVSTAVTPEVSGSVSGGGTYEEGKTVTLTAKPNDGYVFKQWSDGNTDNPRTVTVTGDVTYTAEFESAMPEFTLVQMLYNNKQISKDNKVPAGQSFRLIAGVK